MEDSFRVQNWIYLNLDKIRFWKRDSLELTFLLLFFICFWCSVMLFSFLVRHDNLFYLKTWFWQHWYLSCLLPNVVTEDFSCPFCLMQCASFKVYAVSGTAVIACLIHNLIIREAVSFFSLLEVKRKCLKLFSMEKYWISVYVLILLFEWQSLFSLCLVLQRR